MSTNFEKPPEYKNKDDSPEENEEKIGWSSILGWILQFGIFGAIGFVIYTLIAEDEGLQETSFIICGITYLLYIIIEFCSPTFSYLRHKRDSKGIYEKLSRLYRTAPIISFSCVCYHYETHTEYYTDSEGKRQSRTVTNRVNTYSETTELPYRSTRDVSGLFLLDLDRANIAKKYYIKIHLFNDISFADAISYSDYEIFKTDFYNRNRWRDTYMDFSEDRKIPGFNAHELVLIRESEPGCINPWLYGILTIFVLVQFYKSYVDSFCIRQTYKIRKIVSTRYDLLSPEYNKNYSPMTPAINIQEQSYSFSSEEIGSSYSSADINLPTEEELKKAEIYNSKIPHFRVSKYDESLNSGVVEEGYSSVYDAAPCYDNQGYQSINVYPNQEDLIGDKKENLLQDNNIYADKSPILPDNSSETDYSKGVYNKPEGYSSQEINLVNSNEVNNSNDGNNSNTNSNSNNNSNYQPPETNFSSENNNEQNPPPPSIS
ncbi:MAG: hypothetical protein MJ252_04665 [archaeon]|nr:hypothetical protein [archaeon]